MRTLSVNTTTDTDEATSLQDECLWHWKKLYGEQPPPESVNTICEECEEELMAQATQRRARRGANA